MNTELRSLATFVLLGLVSTAWCWVLYVWSTPDETAELE
jgi:hypothetical protein